MIKDLYLKSRAWPLEEAKKILHKLNGKTPEKGYVLFETGYGPSGLPHIGTFGEVARTSMVRYAFSLISDIPTKLFAFSDDMDALRKVPTNIPNQEMLQSYINKPLSKVADPFGKFDSFAEHNNTMLQNFLNSFGFEYEFKSATHYYKNGLFNEMLLIALEHHEEIKNIIVPTLGAERRETYSPFLPISQKTGNVLQAKVIHVDPKAGTLIYIDEEGKEEETKVTDGYCKMQWKADWALRWAALGVDYEMLGKDLIPSLELSSKICKVLGKPAPQAFIYELFLDKNGEKISKSKGNGLSIEQWLKYGNKESLSYYMYQKPQTAKRLYLEIVPKNVDDWLTHVSKYDGLTNEQKVESPIFFIHKNNPPKGLEEVSFALILNLVAVLKTEDKTLLWNFVSKYYNFNNETKVIVDELLTYCINYYIDFVKPTIVYKKPNLEEKKLLTQLKAELENFIGNTSVTISEVQSRVYFVGKDNNINLKDWFKLLYETLLGQPQGPRMGSFFVLYGIDNSIKLLDDVINA